MNPKKVLYNTAISVQPPYIAGHSLLCKDDNARFTTVPLKALSNQV